MTMQASNILGVASRRMLEFWLRNSGVVWSDVSFPALGVAHRLSRDALVETAYEIAIDASPQHSKRDWLKQIYNRWLAINPNIFRLLTLDDGVVIGFTSVIPLTDEAMRLYRAGRLSEWDFDKPCGDTHSAIAAPGGEPFQNLCIQAITLRRKFWWSYARRSLPVKFLLGALTNHLADFNPVPWRARPCIIADGNVRGEHILRNHGFEILHSAASSADNRPIFELDFRKSKHSPSLESRMTTAALEQWISVAGAIKLAMKHFQSRRSKSDFIVMSLNIDALVADLAAQQAPTWRFFRFTRSPAANDFADLACALSAKIGVTAFDIGGAPTADWRTLSAEMGRNHVEIYCGDAELRNIVLSHLAQNTAPYDLELTGKGEPAMIDFATAVGAAAMLNNSLSAIDKVYDWWKAKSGGSPSSEVLRSDPNGQVLQYVSPADPTQKPLVVMTFRELSQRLTPEDAKFIDSFNQRMKLAMGQWEQLNAELPLAGPVERARIEANMEHMKNRDICASLKQIVDFIESLGIDLHDHYRNARSICGN